MDLHPEDVRYWQGWARAGLVVIPTVIVASLFLARVFLVNPIRRDLQELNRLLAARPRPTKPRP